MEKWIASILALVAALAIVSCAEEPLEPYQYGVANDSVSSDPASVDQQFMNDMITAGMTEVEVSEMAVQKTATRAVREFADLMIRDHRRANHELQRAAAQLDTGIAPHLDEVQQAREQLTHVSGDAFDRAYITMMVADHQQAVSAVEAQVRGSGRAPIQTWASNMLTILREHLNRAQRVQARLP